jgi:hypothetical protein
MGSRKAWVELHRLLERCDRSVSTVRPHADAAEHEVGVWIATIEGQSTLHQLE